MFFFLSFVIYFIITIFHNNGPPILFGRIVFVRTDKPPSDSQLRARPAGDKTLSQQSIIISRLTTPLSQPIFDYQSKIMTFSNECN